MILNVGAVYRPDSDEVWVEFASTQNDAVTVSAADSITLTLQHQTKDLIGTPALHPLASCTIPAQYIRADKGYVARFRHPKRRVDLFLGVSAVYGVSTFTETVEVGQGAVPQQQIKLPDNAQYEFDRYRQPLDQGQGPDEMLEPLEIILSPELQEYAKIYDFTSAQPPEVFQTFLYSGGGNRLLLSSRTAAFELQPLDRAPWHQYAYAFMESGTQNLIPNAFFTTLAAQQPQGFDVDPGGAILTQTVAIDPKTSPDAKIWTIRFRQINVVSAFNQAVVQVMPDIAILPQQPYTFSTYCRIRGLSPGTVVSRLTLVLRWYSGSTFLQESSVDLSANLFGSIDLAQLTASSPAGSDRVIPSVKMGSIDAGDDVELALLAPQLEAGGFATTRTDGIRQTDQISFPYSPENQKFRIEFIPGFGSAAVGASVPLTAGPVVLSFEPGNLVKADLVGYGSVTAPLTFGAGDPIDLTVEHQQSGKLKLWKAGVLLAQQTLPGFSAPPSTLVMVGQGIELIRLTLFSRI